MILHQFLLHVHALDEIVYFLLKFGKVLSTHTQVNVGVSMLADRVSRRHEARAWR